VVSLHPSCGLKTLPKWVIFNEFVLTTKPSIRTVTEIHAEWLLELVPNYYGDLKVFTYNEMRRALQDVLDETNKGTKKAAGHPSVRRR
jgi:pre-mRNA-splicing factor ATP-dependent RNA helicase DHX15/PRP43